MMTTRMTTLKSLQQYNRRGPAPTLAHGTIARKPPINNGNSLGLVKPGCIRQHNGLPGHPKMGLPKYIQKIYGSNTYPARTRSYDSLQSVITESGQLSVIDVVAHAPEWRKTSIYSDVDCRQALSLVWYTANGGPDNLHIGGVCSSTGTSAGRPADPTQVFGF
jgi:hypothetical protein